MSYTASFTPETLSRADVDDCTGPLVLEFGTSWCGWCQDAQRHIKAAFDSVSGDVPHVKIEDGPGRRLGRSFGVKLWPTLVFLKNGSELTRVVRPQDRSELEDALQRLLG